MTTKKSTAPADETLAPTDATAEFKVVARQNLTWLATELELAKLGVPADERATLNP